MEISVIIPFYNEEENVAFVLDEITTVMRPLGRTFEIVAVNDGSHDRTDTLLEEIKRMIPELRIIRHKVNRGQGAAFWTGYHNAYGDILVTLDGDGQNDARDIPRLLDLLKTYDAVMGQRLARKDPLSKHIATRIAYGARQIFLHDGIFDSTCSLKALHRRTLPCLLPVKGFFRFIPFLLHVGGFTYTPLEVGHRPREKGKTKYSLRKLYFFPTVADLIFMWWYKKTNLWNNKRE